VSLEDGLRTLQESLEEGLQSKDGDEDEDDGDDLGDEDEEEAARRLKAQRLVRHFPLLRSTWARYVALTSPLAQQLCEGLRLVLEPQVASRLKGDYRSGKRLNMRRVIPYIASGFRKDKIWLRRTKPSKRSYQVLLAIDDSETMRENGAGAGALAALATLTTGLTQLEVGEVAVLRFGSTVDVLHDFGDPPFGSENGAKCVGEFQFDGLSTPAPEMLTKSIDLFDAADQHSGRGGGGGGGGGEGDSPHQMMFVVSDGRFEQGQLNALRRLNRRLSERKRLLVLLIVDTAAGQSIEKERRISFTSSGAIVNSAYLEDYPLPYYVVLKDVAALPQALSDALRQWFELLQQNQG